MFSFKTSSRENVGQGILALFSLEHGVDALASVFPGTGVKL